jgi:branched-chain amino acid transport system ATP-binding protein
MLELINVSKNFGGLLAVSELSFTVEAGEIVSLIGPNGAGKSTVMNLITGIYAPSSGAIRFNGQSIVGLSPDEITRRGLARTFQSLRLFLNMSVIENVMAAAYPHTHSALWQIVLRTPGFRREERHIRQLAEEKLSFFGTRLQGYRYDQPAYSLSYANRRRLEIARMNPHETEEITHLIADLRARGGYTILVIEHDMSLVAGISDRVIALDYGQKIAEGSFDAVATDERVVEAYLGRKAVTRKQ